MTQHALRGRTRYPGQVFAPAPAPELSAIMYKALTLPIIGSGTSFAITMPSIISAGDLLISYSFTRSALTVPAGWNWAVNAENNGNTQWAQMLYRTAVASDAGATLTFTQATNTRYGFGLVVASVPSTGYKLEASAKTKAAGIAEQPSITSLGNGRFYIGVFSNYYGYTGTIYIGGEEWSIVSVPYRADNRICASVVSGNAGAIPAWTIFANTTPSDSCAMAAVFAPNT